MVFTKIITYYDVETIESEETGYLFASSFIHNSYMSSCNIAVLTSDMVRHVYVGSVFDK